MKSVNDRIELFRKIEELNLHKDVNGEQRRRAISVACEMIAFSELIDQGLNPHWLKESENPMPDIETDKYPVEVKHLEEPRDEDENLSKKGTHSGYVNYDFSVAIERKVEYFVDDTEKKFSSFIKHHPVNNGTASGLLRMFYSRGIDATLLMHQVIMDDIIRGKFRSLNREGVDLKVSMYGEGYKFNYQYEKVDT